MTKTEWSGWVQAIGAIAAVIGAYLVSEFAHRRDLRLKRETALRGCFEFGASLVAVVRAMLRNHATAPMRVVDLKHNLSTSIELGREIRMGDLPGSLIAPAFQMRGIASELDQMIVDAEAEKGVPNLSYFELLLNQLTESYNRFEPEAKRLKAKSRNG